MIVADLLFISNIDRLAALSLRHSLPAIFPFREFAVAGGLASYGTNLADTYHLAGVYTGRIIKGEKPADLPVQQATKVELAINLVLDIRIADGSAELLARQARELVMAKVDVIVAYQTPAASAARQATREIPVPGSVRGDGRSRWYRPCREFRAPRR